MAKSIRNLRPKSHRHSGSDVASNPLTAKKSMPGTEEQLFRFETIERAREQPLICPSKTVSGPQHVGLNNVPSKFLQGKEEKEHRASLVLAGTDRLLPESTCLSRWGELTGNTPPSCLSFLSQDRLQHIPAFSSFVSSPQRKIPKPQAEKAQSAAKGSSDAASPTSPSSSPSLGSREIKAFVGWLQEQRNDVLWQQEEQRVASTDALHCDPWANGFSNESNIRADEESSETEVEESGSHEILQTPEKHSSDTSNALSILKDALATSKLSAAERIVKRSLTDISASFKPIRDGTNHDRYSGVSCCAPQSVRYIILISQDPATEGTSISSARHCLWLEHMGRKRGIAKHQGQWKT